MMPSFLHDDSESGIIANILIHSGLLSIASLSKLISRLKVLKDEKVIEQREKDMLRRRRQSADFLKALFLNESFGEIMLVYIFRNYLSINEMCIFDTALVNRELRSYYLAGCRSREVSITSLMKPRRFTLKCINVYLAWLKSRNFCVSHLDIDCVSRSPTNVSLKRLNSYLIQDFNITNLIFNGNDEGIQKFIGLIEFKALSKIREFTARKATYALVNKIALNCPNLTSFVAGYFPDAELNNRTCVSLSMLAERCPHLTTLILDGRLNTSSMFTTAHDNFGMETCQNPLIRFTQCCSLQFITIRYPNLVTPDALLAIANNCSALASLDLREMNINITDDLLAPVIRSCRNLKSLSIASSVGSRVSHLSDFTLVNIGAYLNHLECLDLSGLMISDRGVHAVAKGCTKLTSIKLDGCPLITDVAIHHLEDNCKNLKSISLQFSRMISPEILLKYSR